jgi:hypothetical protein
MVRGIKRPQLNNSVLQLKPHFGTLLGHFLGSSFKVLWPSGGIVRGLKSHIQGNALISTLEGLNFLPLYGQSFLVQGGSSGVYVAQRQKKVFMSQATELPFWARES